MTLTRPSAPLPASDSDGDAGLRVRVRPGVPLVVRVYGELDAESAPGLRDELLRIMRRHGSCLLLDLAGVSFLDCAGINVLLATRRRARLEGGWLRVVHPSAAAWRVISLLGLQDVLTAERGAGERRA